jgi:hypothetical protein
VNAAFPYQAMATNSGSGTKISATVIFGEGAATMTHYISGIHLLTTPLIVEPALTTYLIQDRVNQVLATAAGSTLVKGDIYFKEGHNCSVTILPVSNTIRIAAVLGAGKGQDCSLPTPASGVRCPEALLRINGLNGGSNGEFAIVGGDGVSIRSDPGSHTIIIKSCTNREEDMNCGGS